MTTLTDTQVITASGGLVELASASKNSNQVITNGAAAATVMGPLTFVADGSPCVVDFYVPRISCGAATDFYFLIEVDGAAPAGITQPRIWNLTTAGTHNVPCSAQFRFTPSAGSHTVTIKAVSVGTDVTVTCQPSNWTPAFLRVSKIVQATQWPAVTTGTIICTSSTRPASPFEGQTIYETDTDLSKIYNGAAWVSPQYQSKPPALSYYWSNVSTTGFSQFVVSGTPTTTQYDSGDISYNASTGVFTLPKNGLYMASFYASPVSGSGYFPVTISVDAASGATQTPPYIGNSYSGAGWASYTTMNASGIFAANGDRQIRFRIYTSATSGFEAFVRLAWISST